MNTRGVILGLLLVAFARPAMAQEACTGTCVADEDLKAFVEIAKEKKCLNETKPEFKLDSVNIVVDRDGHIFYSGANPHPYKLRMKWCHYDIETEGKVDVLAAVQEPPSVGFRFRPKAYLGMLVLEPFRDGNTLRSGIDAGLMLDAFYVHDFNLNVHVGFNAVGAGIGVDIFRSFGAYAGYAMAWDGFHHNPEAALWFSFW